jgi:hypothetical protein
MAARWVGLTRPNKKNFRTRAQAHTFKHSLHALGAGGVLVLAAAMNFAMYPDALAEVVSGERAIIGFVPEEPAGTVVSDSTPTVLNEDEARLLAATVWGEARSEGEGGMRAVAHVMRNRIGPRFGEDISTVILSPKQFSVWNRNDPNRRIVQNLARDPSSIATDPEWLVADRVAREVLSGQSVDPTGGALFYHTRGVRPRWSRVGQGRQVIGQHIFYADVPDPGVRDTPRLIDVAQFLGQALPGGSERRTASQRRGPRAGRVNGVIQYAPPSAARQDLPSESRATTMDVNTAAAPTINGAPVVTPSPVDMVAPVGSSASAP